MTRITVRKQFVLIVVLLLLLGTLAACQSSTPQDTAPAVENTPAPTPTAAPVAETATSEVVTSTTAATTTVESTTTVDSGAQPVASAGVKTFQLAQEGTEARFYIDEVLMGQDKRVLGVTAQVEGQITLDPANPSSAQIGAIRINARDFSTDSERRNGAIQRFVLESNQDQYQYITFEPTAIQDLPATVTIGQAFSFTVVGNLTIRDITREETFQVSVTPNSETELVGLGSTTIIRDNYGLTIPSVPSVANVSAEVLLEIQFRATSS